MDKQNVALVAGSTGIVGEALVELLSKPWAQGGPWKVYGLARRPRPSWLSPRDVYIQCDLLDAADTIEKLAPLTDVTHLFWVTWVGRSTEAENIIDNGRMFRNALAALLANTKRLKHICLQTGAKHYIGPFEKSPSPKLLDYDAPFTEDLPRQPIPNFYYTLEDMLFETVQQSKHLTWTVHRPGAIFGVAAGNSMNLLGTLAVYAALCKDEGLPFLFPGNLRSWESVQDASNADLIAEQEIWAATDSRGQNNAFNIVNGDVFKWKKLWKPLAQKLGVEYVPYNGQDIRLSETLENKGPVWDRIVLEHGLYPSKLADVGHWWFADISLHVTQDNLLSMNKSKEHGFFGFRNTEKSCLTFIDRMRERKLIPKY